MNTYKIKALEGQRKLIFTVDAETLLKAQEAARTKLRNEGFRYALIDTITEMGPSKEPSPAKTEDAPRSKPFIVECEKNPIAPDRMFGGSHDFDEDGYCYFCGKRQVI